MYMKLFLGANAFYADGISSVENRGNMFVQNAEQRKNFTQNRSWTKLLLGVTYICVLVTAGGGMWIAQRLYQQKKFHQQKRIHAGKIQAKGL